MSVQNLNAGSLQSPEEQQKLLDVIKLCSDSKVRESAEKSLQAENIKNVAKELGIPKGIITKMVKVYFKQNYDEEVAIQEQFETLYNIVVK